MKLNWGATPLAGYIEQKGKLNYTVTQDKGNIRHANITQGNKLGGYLQ